MQNNWDNFSKKSNFSDLDFKLALTFLENTSKKKNYGLQYGLREVHADKAAVQIWQ